MTYRLLTGNLLPQISYLTLVDRFVMGNGLIIFLVSVAHAVMSLLNKSLTVGIDSVAKAETDCNNKTDCDDSWTWAMSTNAANVDYGLLIFAFLGWLSGVVWFAVKWKRAENTPSASGQLRESTRRRAAKRAQHDDQEASMLTDSSSSLATMLSDSSAPVSPPR